MEACGCEPVQTIGLLGSVSALGAIGTVLSSLLGCAGFSALDPYNRFFKTISFGGLASLVFSHYRSQTLWTDKQIRLTVALTAIFWAAPYVIGALNEWGSSSQESPESPPIKVKIDGIQCLACANGVHNTLNQIEGVAHNTVSFEEKKAKIFVKPDAKVTVDDIAKVLEEQGYNVTLDAEEPLDVK